MSFTGFKQADFDVFQIDGLDARMEAIKENIRPKFEWLGQHFSSLLSLQLGEEFYTHIAKHARRTVNPPKDTWVAFAPDKRGYKKHPHFQIGLWETHLFVWFAVIYEAPIKEAIGQALENRMDQIIDIVPGHFRWSPDHTQPESVIQTDLGKEGLFSLADRLQRVKKAEILCGITIDRNDPVLSDGNKLVQRIEDVFTTLTKVYKLVQSNSTLALHE